MRKKLYSFIRDKKKNKFLNLFCELGSIKQATEKMGLSRQVHYYWMEHDDTYKIAFKKANLMAGDILKDEAMRRAVQGYAVPIFSRGEQVGEEIRYSDKLLEVLLKARFPDEFKDRATVETVGDGSAGLYWEGDDEVAGSTEKTEQKENKDTVQTDGFMEIPDPSEP